MEHAATCPAACPDAARPNVRPNARTPLRLLQRLRRTLACARTRRSLADLEPHLLRDIGITPEQARAERGRPVWDVPKNWLR